MAFLHRLNKDNVFFRNQTVAVLHFLNQKIFLYNQISDVEVKKIRVPFLFNAANDERFMQDTFLKDIYDDCISQPRAEGNYDPIPRGDVSFGDPAIDTAQLTNRFVRGNYLKMDETGEVKTYNAPINWLPLRTEYHVKLFFDNRLDGYRLLEEFYKIFYKIHYVAFQYQGFTLRGMLGFPEEYATEAMEEFGFPDKHLSSITINIECNAYFPVIDGTQEVLSQNSIQSFQLHMEDRRLSEQPNQIDLPDGEHVIIPNLANPIKNV